MSVSEIYKRRWQRGAYRVLGEFLESDALPAITWTIAISGALVGDVDSLTSTPVEQRNAFSAWAQHLGADVMPERTNSAGVVHLYAKFSRQVDHDSVGGAIRASIYSPMDGEV